MLTCILILFCFIWLQKFSEHTTAGEDVQMGIEDQFEVENSITDKKNNQIRKEEEAKYKDVSLSAQIDRDADKSNPKTWKGFMSVLGAVIVNVSLLITINILYVFAYLSLSNRLVAVIQVLLALFKNIWNGYVVFAIFRIIFGDDNNRSIVLTITSVVVFNNFVCPFISFCIIKYELGLGRIYFISPMRSK
jgi:hypothetical protein